MPSHYYMYDKNPFPAGHEIYSFSNKTYPWSSLLNT